MSDDSNRKPIQLVLLDRDGVINHDSADYIKSASEWRPIPGSLAAISRLNASGIDTALCSNQAGISRGRLSARDLSEIHLRLSKELSEHNGYLSLWRFCPHHPDDNCSCRKPNSAMLLDCMEELAVEPSAVAFIGDSLKDMQAAIDARCLPVLVLTGNDPAVEKAARALGVSFVADNLHAACEAILQHNRAASNS